MTTCPICRNEFHDMDAIPLVYIRGERVRVVDVQTVHSRRDDGKALAGVVYVDVMRNASALQGQRRSTGNGQRYR